MTELILHVGMGKTGTSSIQAALKQNSDVLMAQGVSYLGMWFGDISSDFIGYDGQEKMFSSSAEEMFDHANALAAALDVRKKELGIDRFIISNESMFGNVGTLIPFVKRLSDLLSVKVVAYARNPVDWLPSAYNQWAVYHKNVEGPIPDYEPTARRLINTYNGLILWARGIPDQFSIRTFHKGLDVISDFSSFCGIEIDNPEGRKLERAGAVESVFRAVYNNNFHESVLPQRFDAAVGRDSVSPKHNLSEIVGRSFDYRATNMIVQDNAKMFDLILTLTGVDLRVENSTVPPAPNVDDLRKDVIDSLLRLSMDQAERIYILEQKVKRIESGER